MTDEKLNPKVLGQLLLMQSYINSLPDKKSIFSFVCKGLMDIPGIAKVEFFETQSEKSTKMPFQVYFPIIMSEFFFGEIVIQLSDLELFRPYESYLSNFIFMIGLVLEERRQRQINEQHQMLLEQRIAERTQELILEKKILIESQRRFNDLMLKVKLLTVMLDCEGNIIFCNPYLLSLTQYSYDEIFGRNWFDIFIPKQYVNQVKEVFIGMINGTEILYNYENEILAKDGSKIIVAWNNSILYDENKKITGTASIGENITQRKLNEILLKEKSDEIEAQNEEYLQINEELNQINTELQISKEQAEENKEKYKLLFDNFNAAISVYDKEFRLVLLNDYNAKVLGGKISDFTGKTIYDLFPEDAEFHIKRFKKIIEEKRGNSFEDSFKLPNGTIWFSSILAPVFNYNKEVTGIQIVAFDITEKKKFEQELIVAKERAEELQERFDYATSVGKVGTWDWNLLTDDLVWSTETYRILGYEPFSVKPSYNLFLNMVHPNDREYLDSNVKASWNEKKPYSIDCRIVLPNSEIRIANATGKVEYDKSDKPIRMIGTFHDITERKKIEITLKEIDTQLKDAMTIAKLGTWTYDVATGLFTFSDQLFQILGTTAEQEGGYTMSMEEYSSRFFLPEDAQMVGNETLKALETNDPNFYSQLDHRLIDVHGKVKYISVYIRIVKNEQGQTLQTYGVNQDITERKLSEIIIQNEQERLETILNTVKDPIFVKDNDHRIILANKAFYEIFNTDEKNTIGYTLAENVPEDEKIHFLAVDQKVLDTGISDTHEESLTVNGLSHTIITRKSRFIDHYGNRFLVGSIHDITERKQAEIELLKSKKQVEENIIRLKIAQKASKAGTWDWDIENNSFYWSDEFLEIFGLPKETIAGFEAWTKALHPDDIATATQKIQESIDNNTELISDYRIILPNKEIRWILATGKVFYKDDKPIRMTGLCLDINEQKQNEYNLIKAKEKAEESDRLKTAFLQNMSHEIRTPMNAIMGFSELLVRNFDHKSKLEHFSKIITQRCNDLLVIINDILDISKIESGQLLVSIEPCNIISFFSELRVFFTEHQQKIGKQHINFNLQAHCDSEKMVIATDKVKLKQIFINLITNAFKFTEKGTIEGGCRFDDTKNIIFYVSDTGIGIPTEKHEKIFERFVQLDQAPNRSYGGTGLGLSIVKGLVNLLGGKLWLESTPGKGSTFYFSLPYNIVQENKIEVHDTNSENIKTEYHNKTILIVEDDIFNADFIKEVLSEIQVNSIFVQYGNAAIQTALSQQVDLVLMDVGLPDMTGYEAIQQILQHKPSLKIIAQTAYAAEEDMGKALNAGCVDYISKPLKPKKLLSIINKHLS